MKRQSRDFLRAARDRADLIRGDVANPALRFLARCEGAPVGIMGHCLLCEADQGVSSPLCLRETAKPGGMEPEGRTLVPACSSAAGGEHK